MQISRSKRYLENLFYILEYIAQDKMSASINFKNELDELIENLPNSPYKFRKSIYFNDENIRDMVYKGYTVVYKVDSMKKRIDVVQIFNKNKPPLNFTSPPYTSTPS